ncbi:MAG: type I pantothenate kinase [Chloroflexi bacterium AL-W]|nr:type I pantothenate kinase [Chloroflexi bacterium AL-N1]NOK67689.1 type I pantothenate kinase [Chloroflexi bacterium AL-N10]NOK75541.1 type I pantothenate kinase [Chloroflexi bacterium AL-N5]NOK82329.1 type I pantothenate kinase [Chloroflexi bacterium AL-W]NOK90174.1 type I pantothenate kinase [Chloroflexi bacterium AL-N15]
MTVIPPDTQRFSPYITFTREEWSHLRNSTPMTLSEDDLNELRGLNDKISLDEVEEIYLPLVRLLHLYVKAMQSLYQVTDTFLGNHVAKVPYIIGMAGSVAAGKSTTARIVQALLSHSPEHPRVDLVTTDGFLYPNHVLQERGIMHRKGFPESYDVRALVRFVADLKSGYPEVVVPVYSHLTYDIVPDQVQIITQPDILILEGLNVLQSSTTLSKDAPRVFVSDFFDFSIYVDAAEHYLAQWYIQRFLRLRETAFRDPHSYFRRYADLSIPEAIDVANRIWDEINGANLRENIAPTRERARLILTKGESHFVQEVRLRKL